MTFTFKNTSKIKDKLLEETDNWSEYDLAYLAGFIDGEGSISLFASQGMVKGKTYPRIRMILTAYNTNEEIISWICQTFGGTMRMNRRLGRQKDCYCWATGWQRAALILRRVLPYLKVKKKQAELFIAVAATCQRRGSSGTPSEIVELRVLAAQKMSELNRRGKPDAMAIQ